MALVHLLNNVLGLFRDIFISFRPDKDNGWKCKTFFPFSSVLFHLLRIAYFLEIAPKRITHCGGEKRGKRSSLIRLIFALERTFFPKCGKVPLAFLPPSSTFRDFSSCRVFTRLPNFLFAVASSSSSPVFEARPGSWLVSRQKVLSGIKVSFTSSSFFLWQNPGKP